eukprot:1077139-Amorphochlora_amoeboformis.AAC.1
MSALQRGVVGFGKRIRAIGKAFSSSVGRRSYIVTAGDQKAFREDGVVCIRSAIPLAFVESLRIAAERNMKNPGPLCDEHAAAAGTAGRFHDDQFLWRRHDECREYLFNSGSYLRRRYVHVCVFSSLRNV